MAVSHLTDLFDRAKSRMLSQYRKLTTYVADVGVLIDEVQSVEDAFWDFLGQLDVDSAAGVWLDLLGKIIGEKRPAGQSDADFRTFVKARILANVSDGNSNQLIAIAHAILDAKAGSGSFVYLLTDFYPAAMDLTLAGVVMGGAGDLYLPVLVRLLGIARAVGVKLTITYRTDATEANQFVVADNSGVASGLGFDDAASPNQPTAGKWAGSVEAIAP